jgi:outer membrane receptor for ferrienterochelin and colicins
MKSLKFTFFFLLMAAGLSAQSTIVGKITDADKGEALIGVSVFLDGTSVGTITDANGEYVLSVPSGNSTILFSYIGYSTVSRRVSVGSGDQSRLDVSLEVASVIGQEVVVSVSRRGEKLANAPATISVISAQNIENLPSFNVAELLGRQRGLDYVRSGVLGVGVNARGFNSAFNPKNLQINDNRFSTLIATGLPLGALSTTVKEDIERIEVILGPSSALYGPNAHNGLINTITKDPRVYEGTTVALGAGNQSVLTGRLRHAQVINDKFAFKFSGEYTKGTEFEFTDTVYYFNTAFDNPIFGGPGDGSGVIFNAVPELDLDRDFSSLRGEASLYYSPTKTSDIILTYGGSKSNNIGNTNAGRNQIRDWTMNIYQARYVSPRFFANVYYTASASDSTYAMNQRTQNYLSFINAGFPEAEAKARSFNEQWFGVSPEAGIPLNRGAVFTDDSRRLNGELQYNNQIGGIKYVAGLQYQRDMANSNGTYLLDNGGEDIVIDQIGGYLQLDYLISDNLRAVAAARADNHDLYGFNFIPKAGLVYFNDKGAWRLTYGKGIAAPTILNLEANIFGGLLLGNGSGFTLADGSTIRPLQVETISTIELGYKGLITKKFFFDANAYYNISQDFLSPALNIASAANPVVRRGDVPMSEVIPGTPESGSPFLLTYVNFGKVNTYGFDASLNYGFSSSLSAVLNYSWFGYDIDENDPNNDFNKDGRVDANDLPINTPTHKLGVGLNYMKGKIFASAFGRWVSSYDFFSGINVAAATNTDLIYAGSPVVENARVGRSFNNGPLGGFFNLDVSVGYRITDQITLSGQVINVLNQQVREFVASPIIQPLYSLELKVDLPSFSKK